MELYLFNQINQYALKWYWLDVFGIFCAKYLGYILVLALLFYIVARFRKYRKTGLKAFTAAIFSRFIIVELIRWTWQRPRPFINNTVNLLLEHSAEPAFPSGHAAFYFALATVVFLRNKKLGSLFLFGALLISLSRVFVGVHWLSDILAGAIIGIFSGWLIYKFSDRAI